MKTLVGLGLLATSLAASAQVACTMPNGRTITLNLTHTCPAGAVGAKSLDGQPVQIAQPTSSNKPAPPTNSSAASPPATAPAQPEPRAEGSRVINRASATGCVSRELYEQLTKIAVQGDSEAFTRLLRGSVVAGQCVIFTRGTVVFIEDTAIFSGLVQVRPKGQVRSYWTAIESVSTN